jgi:hypothetical protein
MTVDYWKSSQYEHRCTSPDEELLLVEKVGEKISVPKESVVFIMNVIDTLADQLPKFVRNSLLHYSAMVLAQRYISKQTALCSEMDGQLCCEIATLALYVSIESDNRSIAQQQWDSAVMKVFACEVVHRGILSAVESGKGHFVESLNFDLFVYHPFETVGLLLAELTTVPPAVASQVVSVSYAVINSLYRTVVVVQQPPYVVAIAAVVAGLLLNEVDASEFLSSQPVEVGVVESILTTHLYNFLKYRELPLSRPPPVADLPSPSARTGRSVSRQSSRIPSTRSMGSQLNSSDRKRKRDDPISSLSWALLPALDENSISSKSSGYRRSVSLSELRILREVARLNPPPGIVSLSEVRLYTPAEESMYRAQGAAFVVNGSFDCSGNQFDSIVRLLDSYDSVLNVAEQLLYAVLFLNEVKICHFGIEPQNIMITSNSVKIASLATATVLPTVPTVLPSLSYRPPELLLGPGAAKDDALAVDLWSLGCVLAEITRIYSTRNRYEDPLFVLADSFPDRPKDRFPVHDSQTYMNCRYLIRMAERLNKGSLPTKDVWPDIHRRNGYEAALQMLKYKDTHFPPRKGAMSDDVRAYMRDSSEGVMTEIVMALLRWCPDRRVNPRICLSRIIKHRSN